MYYAVHLAAECYPIAKVGGLGDVVGALPKYLNEAGISSCVLMPKYNVKYNRDHSTETIYTGTCGNENYWFEYSIQRYSDAPLGFDVFLVDIPPYLFREGVYGYEDDSIRFIYFQQAALDWICSWQTKPSVFHAHDYHAGLVPFMINHCYNFGTLAGIKTVFTIHNGLYSGDFSHALARFFPHFPREANGYLDWDHRINPLATAIKCSNKVTTVSGGYLEELQYQPNPYTWLYKEYAFKSTGIVNGIDAALWNPKTDDYLHTKLKKDFAKFKQANKEALCASVGLDASKPLVVFIGRLNQEKGGEILCEGVGKFMAQTQEMNFFLLGSGDSNLENNLRVLTGFYPQNVANYIGYNEALAHNLYAAADFLLMPSLVEPCGLNQLYALRYGTIPIVRTVGGLKDTVVDFGEEGGYGIRFNQPHAGDVVMSLYRAKELYADKTRLKQVQDKAISLDFSWELAVKKYIYLYEN
ncbi:MAG: glycogen synthase [Bacteroidetes bacterium B1(2017)]|nr:MAG: glycogen synthase [Bacteroidetes bacterium B1(2017)]